MDRTLVLYNDSVRPGNFQAGNGYDPMGLTYDSAKGETFVSNGEPNPAAAGVSVIDDTTGRVSAFVPDPDGFVLAGLSYDSAKGEIFGTDYQTNCLTVINDTTDHAVLDLSYGGLYPVGIAYDRIKGEFFVANSGSGNVSVVNDTTWKVTSSISLGSDSEPYVAVYDPARSEVFVTEYATGDVAVISDVTDMVVATVSIPSAAGDFSSSPVGAAYVAESDEIAVTVPYLGQVSLISTATDAVAGTIHTGKKSLPWALADDPLKGELFVTNEGGHNVTVVSESSGRPTASVNVGVGPYSAVYEEPEGAVVVANYRSFSASQISDSSNRVTRTIVLGTEPETMSYDPISGTLYTALAAPAMVDAVSATKDRVLRSIATVAATTSSGPPGDWGSVFDPNTNQLFVSDPYKGAVYVISLATNRTVATISTGGTASFPEGMAYDSAKHEVFVALSGAVLIVSDSTDKVVATVSTDAGTQWLVYDQATGEVWAADFTYPIGEVQAINDTTNAVGITVRLPGAEPYALTLDSAKGELFVSDYGDGYVTVLSATSGAIVHNVTIAGDPAGIVYDSANGEVYVAQSGLNTVVGISDTSYAITETDVNQLPVFLAIDPANGDLFVTDSEDGTLTILST